MSSNDYALLERLADGVVLMQVHLRRGGDPLRQLQLWATCRVRGRVKRCAICNLQIASGELAYRPVTNALNRAERICAVACLPPTKEKR